MSGGHAHALHVHGHSPVHRLAPQIKLVALALFVSAVVITPRHAVWAFGVYAGLVLLTLVASDVPARFFLRRIAIEIPFVAFAVLLPVVGRPPDLAVGPLALSIEGLWGAWTILIKGTLGVSASVLLAATTEIPDLLAGLDRLRAPRVFTAIAGFMVRYLDLIASELARMRTAMSARGYAPRWWWQNKAPATAAGALFIRSYERGERVYQAMAARGFTGTMPALHSASTPPRTWAAGLSLPALAVAVALVALLAQ